MPWTTPSLTVVRQRNRDYIASKLKRPLVPNSLGRALADAGGGLGHLNLQYLDWLARQLLPDTQESDWLDRSANMWLVNADGTRGRKLATYAAGSITVTGVAGSPLNVGSQLVGFGTPAVSYETTGGDVVLGAGNTPVTLRALIAGAAGNREAGDILNIVTGAPGVNAQATVVLITGGTDPESDANLLARILQRFQNPPMGGAAHDYVGWAEQVAGVTRAWVYPQEMGIGTVTVRFMCDVLRAGQGGIPQTADIAAVADYLNIVRPVTAQDLFVPAPIADPVNIAIANLLPNNATVKAAIATSLGALFATSIPGTTMFAETMSAAIRAAQGVVSFDLSTGDAVMPDNGHLPALGVISYS